MVVFTSEVGTCTKWLRAQVARHGNKLMFHGYGLEYGGTEGDMFTAQVLMFNSELILGSEGFLRLMEEPFQALWAVWFASLEGDDQFAWVVFDSSMEWLVTVEEMPLAVGWRRSAASDISLPECLTGEDLNVVERRVDRLLSSQS